jgi:hypothetical protein
MVTEMLAKVAISLLAKLLTEKFFAKILIASLDTWSKQTANEWDDKVTAAMAEAMDVPIERLKPAA